MIENSCEVKFLMFRLQASIFRPQTPFDALTQRRIPTGSSRYWRALKIYHFLLDVHQPRNISKWCSAFINEIMNREALANCGKTFHLPGLVLARILNVTIFPPLKLTWNYPCPNAEAFFFEALKTKKKRMIGKENNNCANVQV